MSVALLISIFISSYLIFYKKVKTTQPEITPTSIIKVNALITGLRSSWVPEKYEIAPLETVFISAAIITAIPATSEDNCVLCAKRVTLRVIASTSVKPVIKLAKYTPDDPKNVWEYSTTIKTKANKIIVIEKGAMFTRLIEEQAFKKFKAVLIHTAGQPPRSTRHLIKRLNAELKLPVYVFCDGDPWGMAIAITIICGSANAAHLKELTTPDAQWKGLYSSDIGKYKLPSVKLTPIDIKRLYDLQKDPRCQIEPWQSQIKHFLKQKKKCELEAFSRYGLDYVVKKYLPEKL